MTPATFGLAALGVLLVYYLLPRRPQNAWLLLASYAFLLTWAWEFALLLMLLTVANFILALRLPGAGRSQRVLLWLSIGLNILTLAVFRTTGFFVSDLVQLVGRLGLPTQPGGLLILVPVGLSYYVLENISYLVDVYRGQLPPTRSFVDFALYLAYFPKLLAGPIERAHFPAPTGPAAVCR